MSEENADAALKEMDAFLELYGGLTLPEGYSAWDAYRDFRNTFLESDHGRRTLKVLMDDCFMRKSTLLGRPIDSLRVAAAEGQRNVILKIFNTMLEEPKEKPDRQNVTGQEQE